MIRSKGRRAWPSSVAIPLWLVCDFYPSEQHSQPLRPGLVPSLFLWPSPPSCSSAWPLHLRCTTKSPPFLLASVIAHGAMGKESLQSELESAWLKLPSFDSRNASLYLEGPSAGLPCAKVPRHP